VGSRLGHHRQNLRLHQPHRIARSTGTVVSVIDEQYIAEAYANHLRNQFPAFASNNNDDELKSEFYVYITFTVYRINILK